MPGDAAAAATPDPAGTAVGLWQAAVRGPDGRAERMVLVESGAHPDGTRINVPAHDAAQVLAGAVCAARYGAEGAVIALEVDAARLPKAPPLWFVELRESTARPPAVHLVAFTGHGQPPGVLVDEAGTSNLSITAADQLAAVRWYPATGELDQIYVDPRWRRRGIATALVWAAATLVHARDWSRLWSDGQRTVLGERFRNGSSFGFRAAELTHVAPPMTPGERVPTADASGTAEAR